MQLISIIDPLKYMFSCIVLIGHLAKWVMLLSKFDIQYIDSKALKGHTIADHLADTPLVAYHPLIMEFLYEHLCLVNEQPS